MRTYGAKRKAGDDTESDEESRKRPKAAGTVPPSPSKLPRDLSQIFELATTVTPSSSPSPKRIASRMLGRSKTESSLESSPSRSNSFADLRRPPSLPSVLSSSPSKPPPPPAPGIKRPSAKRTYAGKSRSFLVRTVLPNDDGDGRESYAVLRERWGIDASEDDPNPISHALGSPQKKPKMNPLKSQTELRNKGETRRFLDEVGYLLEGMDPGAGAGLRRTSALDISNQLCDAEFTRKAKAADFIGQTWDAFVEGEAGAGNDKLYDLVFCFFVAVVSRDTSSLSDIATRDSMLASTLVRLLGEEQDPLKIIHSQKSPEVALRKLGIKKNDLVFLKSIHASIIQSKLFSNDTLLTTPLLITHILCALAPSFLSTDQLPVLLHSLRAHLQSSDYEATHNLLRLLDSYLLGQWTVSSAEEEDYEWLLDDVVSFGVQTQVEASEAANECLDMVLRILVSVTHGDEEWCRKVLEHDSGPLFVMREIARCDGLRRKARVKLENDAADKEDAHLLDRLCLALGVLTNVVQQVDDAKDTVRELKIDASCRACVRRCSCPAPQSALKILVDLYTHQTGPNIKQDPELESSADATFLLGHLSVLFGLLMRGRAQNQALILDSGARLGGMVEHASELADFYVAVGGQGEVMVVREVILFLSALRDDYCEKKV